MTNKITFLIADLNLRGGGERVTVNLANALHTHFGFETTIISIQPLENELPYPPHPTVSVESLDIDLHKKGIFNKFFSKIRSIIQVRTSIGDESTDVILGIGTYPSILLRFVRRSCSVRIACEHSSLTVPSWYWSLLRRLSYPGLDGVVFLTERDLDRGKVLNRNRVVIPNARPFSTDTMADMESQQILSIGRLDPQKGFDKLITVFSHIVKECPEWSLSIVGEGGLRDKLQSQISKLGLEHSVTIHPPTSEIINHYLSSSIYAMTSHFEGFPMVLLEAQTCGIPTVSYNCPTGPEEIILDGRTGYLVSPGNESELARKLIKLMRDPTLRKQMSRESRKRSEHFSEERICKIWNKLLNQYISLTNDPVFDLPVE